MGLKLLDIHAGSVWSITRVWRSYASGVSVYRGIWDGQSFKTRWIKGHKQKEVEGLVAVPRGLLDET